METPTLTQELQVAVETLNPGQCFVISNKAWMRVGGTTDYRMNLPPQPGTFSQSANIPQSGKIDTAADPRVGGIDIENGDVAMFPQGLPVTPVSVLVSINPMAQAQGGNPARPMRAV